MNYHSRGVVQIGVETPNKLLRPFLYKQVLLYLFLRYYRMYCIFMGFAMLKVTTVKTSIDIYLTQFSLNVYN